MTALFALIGAAIGLTLSGHPGAGLAGGLLGFVVASTLEHRSRIRELERALQTFSSPAPSSPERVAEPRRNSPRRSPASHPEAPPATLSSPRELEPELLECVWSWARPFLTGSSLMVTVGVVVLFFGVAFLLKYAVELGLLPIELRLAAAAFGGVALVALGLRTRRSRPGFGLTLQGGGLGILYLTVFAAFRLYSLVPGAMAFALLVLFAALSAAFAVVQNSLALATLAALGGFLAPVLTSTGQGSPVVLFSYYVVLNAGILATAWFRSYRLLNLLGFVFTFIVSAIWGSQYYRPDHFATTEPFLLGFFLLYVAIAVVVALRQAPSRNAVVDGTLVFGVPLATAVLQGALVQDYEYGMAWSAVAFGALYITLAAFLLRHRSDGARPLGESFLGTGVVFITLAIPFAFESLVTSAFWALEGAAMVWAGARQRRLLPRLAGCALQILAGFLFLADPGPAGARAVLNGRFAGGVVIALAGLATALHLFRRLERPRDEERPLIPIFFAWGLTWWLLEGLHEIGVYASAEDRVLGFALLFLSCSAAIAVPLGRRLAWPLLENVSLGFLPTLPFAVLYAAYALEHPFAGMAAAGWLVALATHLVILKTREPGTGPVVRLWHSGGLWLVCLLAAWQSSYLVHRALTAPAWGDMMWAIAPLSVVFLIVFRGREIPWPVRAHLETYRTLGIAPIAGYLYLWVVSSSFSSPWDPNPLPYVPLLSPIDLTVLVALVTFLRWLPQVTAGLETTGLSEGAARALVAGSAFVWAHGVIFRAVHFSAAVRFEPHALFDSVVVQTLIAVLWAVTGLGCMVAGTRRGNREQWAAGAALMGAVVIKLFLVDLSHTGTVARIVSFVAVGLVLLVVGYFSPVPPRSRQEVGTA